MWNEVTSQIRSALKSIGLKRNQYSVSHTGPSAKLKVKLLGQEKEREAIKEIAKVYYSKKHTWLCLNIQLSDGTSEWMPLSLGSAPSADEIGSGRIACCFG